MSRVYSATCRDWVDLTFAGRFFMQAAGFAAAGTIIVWAFDCYPAKPAVHAFAAMVDEFH